MKTILILFTLIFVISPAFGQEEERRSVSQKDSLRLQNYKVISLTTGDSQVQNNSPSQNFTSIEEKVMVKNHDGDYSRISELDELITNYWTLQAGIKEAKNNSDLEQLDQYESNSVILKTQFIELYENLSQANFNPEYTKLYNQFSKDF